MPLLEVTQTRHLSASIRLTDTTASQVDQYAAFIHASADDVVEQALAYVFAKDRDFQEFLKSPEAQRITPLCASVEQPPMMQRSRLRRSLQAGCSRQYKCLLLWRVRRHDPPSKSVAVPARCFAPEEC
ncbi:MAG: hypothetical protein WDN23_15295 [Edaphobacter sp.]